MLLTVDQMDDVDEGAAFRSEDKHGEGLEKSGSKRSTIVTVKRLAAL